MTCIAGRSPFVLSPLLRPHVVASYTYSSTLACYARGFTELAGKTVLIKGGSSFHVDGAAD